MGHRRIASIAAVLLTIAALAAGDQRAVPAPVRHPTVRPRAPGAAAAGKLWVSRYDGPAGGEDYAAALGVSPDGSTVYVTGNSFGPKGAGHFATVAYDAATGKPQWVRRDDLGANGPAALAVSPDGSVVFATGEGDWNDQGFGFATVAYDASTGKKRWLGRYHGAGAGTDQGFAISVSPDGDAAFVTGESIGPNGDSDYFTLAYRASNGALRWTARYDGPAGGDDAAFGITIDPDGSTVFVAGVSDGSGGSPDAVTVAYASSDGSQRWVSRYDGPAKGYDIAYDPHVSPDGSTVFLTGYSAGSGLDYLTIALKASTGKRVWVSRYDGPGHDEDDASGLALSPDGSLVFVTGESTGSNGATDYATVAYAAATGAERWLSRYDGPDHGYDSAIGLAVSPDGSRVFVTGTAIRGAQADYATAEYEAVTGHRIWVRWYAGQSGGQDSPTDIGVAPNGSSVFVTGDSYTQQYVASDYATVAYRAG